MVVVRCVCVCVCVCVLSRAAGVDMQIGQASWHLFREAACCATTALCSGPPMQTTTYANYGLSWTGIKKEKLKVGGSTITIANLLNGTATLFTDWPEAF